MTADNPIETAAAALREDFTLLGDWEARFAYIIDLGKALPPLAAAELVEPNKVRGCTSQVWLVAEPSSITPGAIAFRGASDALIVAGLVGVILKLYSDRTPAEILAFDADAFFRDIGVASALSPARSNGLRSMLTRIRDIAKAAG